MIFPQRSAFRAAPRAHQPGMKKGSAIVLLLAHVHLCALVPRSVPSGSPVLTFEACR